MAKVKTDKEIKDIIKDKTDILQKYILNNCISKDLFTGPAKYFPEEALKSCKEDFLGDRHIEMIYATLAAWGMHRLGEKGAEMPDYKCFKCRILNCKKEIEELRGERIERISKDRLDTIVEKLENLVFREIIASGTDSHLVASTKTLAHILPDLVPPMDRHYTAKYFGKSMQNPDQQKKMFKFVMNALWSVYQDEEVRKKALAYNKNHPSVSLPKLFDNAIIQIRRENEVTTEGKTKGTK